MSRRQGMSLHIGLNTVDPSTTRAGTARCRAARTTPTTWPRSPRRRASRPRRAAHQGGDGRRGQGRASRDAAKRSARATCSCSPTRATGARCRTRTATRTRRARRDVGALRPAARRRRALRAVVAVRAGRPDPRAVGQLPQRHGDPRADRRASTPRYSTAAITSRRADGMRTMPQGVTDEVYKANRETLRRDPGAMPARGDRPRSARTSCCCPAARTTRPRPTATATASSPRRCWSVWDDGAFERRLQEVLEGDRRPDAALAAARTSSRSAPPATGSSSAGRSRST